MRTWGKSFVVCAALLAALAFMAAPALADVADVATWANNSNVRPDVKTGETLSTAIMVYHPVTTVEIVGAEVVIYDPRTVATITTVAILSPLVITTDAWQQIWNDFSWTCGITKVGHYHYWVRVWDASGNSNLLPGYAQPGHFDVIKGTHR
jgi:hypothetical protein